MRIGEFSRRTGVSERLLRYYEEQGLLYPQRRSSGYREYREGDVAAVRQIRALLAAGLGTSLIARVLPCMREDGDHLVPTCAEMLGDLREARDRMTRAIDELHSSRDKLDAVIASAPLLSEAS
ncbi:MerR family transcriptional regulator [Streptomyces sp. NPDC051662]|uniref:MerR family transcriptional regulator n=1 Tax=Streptomyces sp. NPDC051662 TaxID=3154750 RepID=UPI00342A3305